MSSYLSTLICLFPEKPDYIIINKRKTYPFQKRVSPFYIQPLSNPSLTF